jgi:hypothetical protein
VRSSKSWETKTIEPKIHLAFRFHTNFYHSYRGDTPDELGFGKDIRIIRAILQVLDTYNQHGIPVRGTWDIENYFTLEKIIPAYCPDILEGLQRRVKAGQDEVQYMSYNNGLINAHTSREFEAAMRRAVTNPAGSGLRDLFGENVENQVRPQEMMYTPIHLKLYRGLGIESISLYYSAIPFNAFSNFIPPLETRQRYNPLTLSYPGISETMTLLPASNAGDLVDHLTLRRWVKQMRRDQLAMAQPCDLLLLLDQDADDPTWIGFDVPGWLKKGFSTLRGLPGLLDDVLDLEYIQFTTPGRYIKDHLPVGSLTIRQDTADGSFDGLSSWVEKWSNHLLFTGLERARILDMQTRCLAETLDAGVRAKLEESFEARLKLLSTTHFGMAAPVMNLTRERSARDLARLAFDAALAAFTEVAPVQPTGTFCLVDYVRGESTSEIEYRAYPSQALIRLPLRKNVRGPITLLDAGGMAIPCAQLGQGSEHQIAFIDHFDPLEQKQYRIVVGQAGPVWTVTSLFASPTALKNDRLQLFLDEKGKICQFLADGKEVAGREFLSSAVTYAGRTYRVGAWKVVQADVSGPVAHICMQGSVRLLEGFAVKFERELLLAAGLPYLYVSVRAIYPRTPDHAFDRAKAARLQQAWDAAWQEVLPCEIRPEFAGWPGNPLRVWKHDFCDTISSFDLDYGRFSRNHELPSVNNQITHAWLAVSDGSEGLLVAQSADSLSSVAFCPLRVTRRGSESRVLLNPFGSYSGHQYRSSITDTGLGTLMAVTFSAADHLKPYAPSYNGRLQEFSLLLAPYTGDKPPEPICRDAQAFAYPYLVLNDNETIAVPQHRIWNDRGLGESPRDSS